MEGKSLALDQSRGFYRDVQTRVLLRKQVLDVHAEPFVNAVVEMPTEQRSADDRYEEKPRHEKPNETEDSAEYSAGFLYLTQSTTRDHTITKAGGRDAASAAVLCR